MDPNGRGQLHHVLSAPTLQAWWCGQQLLAKFARTDRGSQLYEMGITLGCESDEPFAKNFYHMLHVF